MAGEDAFIAEVRDYILGEFLPGEDPASLKEDTQLAGGGVLNSIDTIKLVAWLEDHYGVFLTPKEVAGGTLKTLRTISAAIAAKKK